jgi:hypothetical protein
MYKVGLIAPNVAMNNEVQPNGPASGQSPATRTSAAQLDWWNAEWFQTWLKLAAG